MTADEVEGKVEYSVTRYSDTSEQKSLYSLHNTRKGSDTRHLGAVEDLHNQLISAELASNILTSHQM